MEGVLTVHAPEETETLEDYFVRYKNEELKQILSHPKLSIEFCSTLLKTKRYGLAESKGQLQRLWDQIKYLNNYGRLQHFMERLKPVRQNLMRSLEKAANQIEQYTKYGSILRLVSSATDIAGTVGGLWMRNSNFDHSSYAFTAASVSGFIGTVSTIAEVYLSTNASADIMKQLQKDERLFTPIRNWFQQEEGLYQAFLNIFPFDNADDIVKELMKTANSQFSGAVLLAKFLSTVALQDFKHIRNMTFVRNMISLFSFSEARDLCEWMILHHSPISLEISKMMIQVHYSPLFIFCQTVPALSPNDQNLMSVPICGRITLNFITFLDAVKTLRKPEISDVASNMKYYRKELQAQLDALEQIIQYCERKRKKSTSLMSLHES